jgi:hypothetical protein
MTMKCPSTPEEVLARLNNFGHRVDFQDLGARVLKEKNRVISQFRAPSGSIATAVATGGLR